VSKRKKKKWIKSTNLPKNIPVGAIVAAATVGAFVAVVKPEE